MVHVVAEYVTPGVTHSDDNAGVLGVGWGNHNTVIYIFYIPIGTFSMSVVLNGEFTVNFLVFLLSYSCRDLFLSFLPSALRCILTDVCFAPARFPLYVRSRAQQFNRH